MTAAMPCPALSADLLCHALFSLPFSTLHYCCYYHCCYYDLHVSLQRSDRGTLPCSNALPSHAKPSSSCLSILLDTYSPYPYLHIYFNNIQYLHLLSIPPHPPHSHSIPLPLPSCPPTGDSEERHIHQERVGDLQRRQQ